MLDYLGDEYLTTAIAQDIKPKKGRKEFTQHGSGEILSFLLVSLIM